MWRDIEITMKSVMTGHIRWGYAILKRFLIFSNLIPRKAIKPQWHIMRKVCLEYLTFVWLIYKGVTEGQLI